MDNINTDAYKVTQPIALAAHATLIQTDATEEQLEQRLEELGKKIAKIQEKMYAQGKYGVLIGLQGMDTSGKDSLIREVFKEFNVRGVVVHSFKQPTELELKHDYLWRHYLALPERGKFAIFNRTHYENVLVTRVHPEYILGENLPDVKQVSDVNTAFWARRFAQIENFENHVVQNGTIVLKFFLHLSKEEQRQRLLRRLEEEKHNWKFSPGDLKERALWEDYQRCYEDAINRTSTAVAPWYVIPADNKDAARVLFAEILLAELKKYKDIDEPELDDKVKANIAEYRKQLTSEQ
ncbi:PPK2 family polyphosphate kinase [Flavobacterium caeni]|uniref:Polyphosphate:nucleotide phosphotransferase, PPK2 family n=1 Tax=Flavobacterium caeni TaxID=490189 RepID=A0A1G5AK18_9FLAO|nr:PPK2 family polyphosphate kinase [Flavobacterium caeni]SCX78239.1 polyphosphate:nucleotide phosphotransferase, PPK2 family [Flavobacterium caeni]